VTTVELRPHPAPELGWRHLPALDGLRAAAVVAVLLFHAGHLQGGFLGVDLFFALSGFLITSLLVRDAGGHGVRLVAFWGRRFRRLLPAVFTLIVVVALWSWWFGSAADLEGVKRDGPWAVVYLANWHFISEAEGYWASFAQPSMFDHLWSLAIEEQFYVVWPVAVLAMWRWTRRPQRALVATCVAGVVASFVAMLLIYDGGDPTRVYMGTDTRAASLLVGALAAAAPVRGLAGRLIERLGRRVDAVAAAIALAVVWSWFAVDGASSGPLYRGGLLLHSTACALLVLMVATAHDTRASSVLSWGPLPFIGTLSYGLYLWHWPVYVALSPERTDLSGWPLTFVRIAVSAAAAYASFRLVEDPIRHRSTWTHGWSGAVALGCSVVAVLGLLVVLPDPEAEIATFDPATIDAVVTVPVPSSTATPVTTPRTTPPPTSAPDRTEPVATVPPETTVVATAAVPVVASVLWAGDSVAFDISPGLVAALSSAGPSVDASSAYPGLRLISDDAAITFSSFLQPHLARSGADTVVLQISMWDITASDEQYEQALRDLATQLSASGARLVLVNAPPTGDSSLNTDLERLAAVAARVAGSEPADEIWFLDATVVWGEGGVLDLDGDGAPERKRDLIHVCPAGAARFGAWFVTAVDAQFDGVTPVAPSDWAGGPWVADPRYDDPAGACAAVS
jgi:peptidoglycan/LPS O-acetylase OafA/YrhL